MILSNNKLALLGLMISLNCGCASRPLRPIDSLQDLPADLPSEVKEKFEIRGEEFISETVAVKPLPVSEKGKKGSRGRKTKSLVKVKPPFVYPTRRSLVQSIYVGEKLTYSIQYLGLLAGDLDVEVLPFKKVNQRKVYHIRATASSSPVFGLFYRLHDTVETFFDFEGIFSHRFHLVLDESKQTRNSLELYDSEKKQTFYWNLWDHKTLGHQETKEFLPIEPFSQDSVSALFYMRSVPLQLGQEVKFPVVSEGKSWEATCKILRRETVNSPFGRVQALVIQPEMKYQGILKKTGDSFLWLTDDERRIPIRLEAKVKIGSVVAQLKQAELGVKPQPAETPSPSSPPSAVSSQGGD